ncbi:MAG: hypothetical protein K9M07_05075 [Simkaniaceae bacterium]|nr:hypothetical protein [Simkaniaceae bacterium]MCF7852594.1 hypothetical protein [Simkaniaceae bacterium]
MRAYKSILLTVQLFLMTLAFSQTDLVIFSYDRPLQLYALLESIEHNVKGLNQQIVIYRTSQPEYEKGYQEVKKAFRHVIFKAQNPKHAASDFKPLVMNSMFNPTSSAQYALFAVDDIIVTHPIDLDQSIRALEKTGAYCCLFRLGMNIHYSYSVNQSCEPPKGQRIKEDFLMWTFADGKHDWAYPNNVDFTLYRKNDILPFFRSQAFTYPNNLETPWAKIADVQLKGICYNQSCIINIPMNVISTQGNHQSFQNRQMHYKTTKELLQLFQDGYKINIRPLQGFLNPSPHFDIKPEFIKR